MGLCASSSDEKPPVPQEVAERNHAVANQLKAEEQKEAAVRKLLLLGPGASGKS
jgi:hypothetical protein